MSFWLTASTFHLVFSIVCLRVARRWQVRLASTRPAAAWVRVILLDAVGLLGVAVVLAAAGAFIGPRSGFTAVRLLAQGLFGETILLTGAIAWLIVRSHRWIAGLTCSLVPLGLVAIYWEAYHREPTDLRVRHHAVEIGQAPEKRRLRILHLSDIQADHVGAYEERAIALAGAQGADLVVWTGDYVQPRLGSTRERATADLNALLRSRPLHAPLGSFAVRGDVDRDWPAVFDGTGIEALTDESARVQLPSGRFLSVIGLTPGMSHGRGRDGLLDLVRRAPAGDIRIVLGHGPDFVVNLAKAEPIDLALAGHTHGGQVVLPFLGPPYTKSSLPRRNASGLSLFEGVPLHVSAGIGMERGSAPQIRFLCPPEICVIEVVY